MRRQVLSPRLGCKLAAAVSGGALVTLAHAQLGATLSFDSDYRYRGVSLSRSNPSPRLTLNYDAAERWYAGASLTRATLKQADAYIETTGYLGWTSAPVDRRSVEVGISASHFAGIPGYDFVEPYIGVIAERWIARLYYSPSYYGRHVRVTYVELEPHVVIGAGGRLFAHAGALVPLGGGAGDAVGTRLDASVGAGLVIGSWDLHVAATAVTGGGPYPAVFGSRRTAVTAGASFSF